MNNRILHTFAFLILASLFLGSCKKGLVSKRSSADSLKADSNAVVSTVYGGYYAFVAPDKTGDLYTSTGVYGNDTVYKFTSALAKSALYVSPATTNADTLTHHTIGCLTTDSTGNVYAIEYNSVTGTNVIKITPAGSASVLFSNIAASGYNQFVKIALDASGNFYYLDQQEQIHKIAPGGTASIAVSQASGFAIDKYGDIIYDNTQWGLEKLTPAGVTTTITTIPGSGTSVSQLATDDFGNIYAGVSANNKINIIKINAHNVASTIISSPSGYTAGPAKTAEIGYPFSLVADASGNLYFCNEAPNLIAKITF